MVGNKSTGIRSRLVTPITISARQMTTIKYGLRIEKRDICAHLTLLSYLVDSRASPPGRTGETPVPPLTPSYSRDTA